MLDGNQAAQRREVVVKHPYNEENIRYMGDKVYSITEKGIVIAVVTSRILYPWHRVMLFNYHTDDVEARKVIQGW